MRIALIGAGKMGQALARLFSEAGHEVVLSNSRGPDSLTDLTADLGANVSAARVAEAVEADVVALCTPFWKAEEAVAPVEDWSGKILIDTTNNRKGPGPDGVIDTGGRGSSEVVADLVPGARLVKAFNNLPIFLFGEALEGDPGEKNAMFIAGDDADAKATVAELLASIGAEAVDAGGLESGGRLFGTDGPLTADPEKNPARMLTPAEAREELAKARAETGTN